MTGNACVTIGVFDGVHRGHQALIEHAVVRARAAEQRCLAVTFDPNPLEVLRPDDAPTRLVAIERRIHLLQAAGVDDVIVVDFTPALAEMSAADFASSLLRGDLGAQQVVVGVGFRFGNRANGSAATLREAGLQVTEYDLVGGGQPVSSTRIRAAIAVGDVTVAGQMLGRPAEVSGVVQRGHQRGRQLGYPTANIVHHRRAAVPADGVYAGRTEISGRVYPSAISVGSNPTFAGTRRTVESHVLDFDADIYGAPVRVEFVERLRGMESFDSVTELTKAMAADVQRTRSILGM